MKRLLSRSIVVLLMLGMVWGMGLAQIVPEVLATQPDPVPLDLIPPTEITTIGDTDYAAGIQAGGGDLTTLVVLITNYVLGFLGLLAISAIIYAGILYVANFGNDEMASKAKTIIFYVAIGILVILLSYAIVNALVGAVGGGTAGRGGGIGAGSPGRVSISDTNVTTLDSLFDVEGKDFVQPLVTTLRQLGDLCESTPIGLLVNNTGCSQNQRIPDTDSDGVANILDTDDDNDGIVDGEDLDADGDGIACDTPDCNGGPDLCPNTLSFVTFKVSDIERNKLQIDRVTEQEYLDFIADNQGCAEYERSVDIDGDGVLDPDDCDADSDGLLDNVGCAQRFFVAFPPGNINAATVGQDQQFEGAFVIDVIRDELDDDDDNDGVQDFGAGLQPEAAELLKRQLTNNFAQLESFIRITCATLPQTTRVQDFCGYFPPGHPQEGEPFGLLVSMLDDLGSDITQVDFERFNEVYQDFLAIASTFPRVTVDIQASQFEGFLPTDGSPLRVAFDASGTIDPFQDFCPVDDNNYLWFVNKTLDFSQGLAGILQSSLNAPDGTGLFYQHDFVNSGVFNVQLLVRSACKFNTVNPGSNESGDVDAAVAGLASVRIGVFPPQARLVVSVNGQADQGSTPVKILAGTPALDFDLTASSTNQGTYTSLDYNCSGAENGRIEGGPENWSFTCNYPSNVNNVVVNLTAFREGFDDVRRDVNIDFQDVIAFLRITPGLRGTTQDIFTFSSASQSSSPIRGFVYTVDQRRGTDFNEVEVFNGQESVTYQFPEPGEYRVTLEVSTGGGADQTAEESKTVIIEPQPPVAAFRFSFPENIRPARVLLDGSLSFHPDFPDDDSVLDFSWEVDGVTLTPAAGTAAGPFTYERVTDGRDDRIFYTFQSIGEHEVILTVSYQGLSDKLVDTVIVDTLLGVDFEIDSPATRIDEVVTFTPTSADAVGYFWDFDAGTPLQRRTPDDDERNVVPFSATGSQIGAPFQSDQNTLVATEEPVVHIYTDQGEYLVRLTVEDANGNTNFAEKKVRVGIKEGPVAFAQVFVNSIEQDLTQTDCIEVTRRDNVVFDAGDSININGETSGISFLWEIEDFDEVVRTRTFTRIYKDLTGGGCIDVDLTVTDLSTQLEDQLDTISIDVVNIPPQMTDIRFTATQQQLVTPVTTDVAVVGVRDLDGRVERYRWWYYEEGQGGERLDVRVTDIPRTTFVIPPRNVEGTDTTYYFVVELEDNDGGILNSEEVIGQSKPLVVTNGPNVAPIAEFVTDRGTVQMNELITFQSTTRDPLGEFIPSAAYQWDFEGDGEFERGVSGERVTHRYTRPGTYQPTLKVTKNGLTSQYNMTIRVLPSTREPEAAFIFVQSGAEVKFVSNSTVDDALDNKDIQLAWDFDTTIDTDGNGIPDDDADAATPTAEYVFEGDRDVLVGLRVTDSVGNTDQVVRKIPFIVEDRERGPLGATRVVPLRAVLKTNPPRNEIDGRLYLTPPASDVIFNSQASTGKIQEYRIDTNIFVDTDGDEIPDNDVDNKTHESWKNGKSFRARYRESDERIRAKLTLVDLDGRQKSQVVDIIFAEDKPVATFDEVSNPDEILQLLEAVPTVQFDVEPVFASPGQTLTFDASATTFPDEQVKEYRWDFDGDGLVDEISFEPQFSHVYEEDGVFDVILEAESDGGLLGDYSQTVFIRGGLELPQASFDIDLRDNEVVLTNTSTFDGSMTEEEIQYEWTFRALEVSSTAEWTEFEQVDSLEVTSFELGLAPQWAREEIFFDLIDSGTGVLPRQAALGPENMVMLFEEGTAFVTQDANAYRGVVRLDLTENPEVSVEGETALFQINTGIDQVLSVSPEARLFYDGIIDGAKLYALGADGRLTFLQEGFVQDNLTVFLMDEYGGQYVITGAAEGGATEQGALLGVSTVKDPVKVLPSAGVYQIVLKVTDSLGEISETSELVTIDSNLQLVEPGTVEPEDILGEQTPAGGEELAGEEIGAETIPTQPDSTAPRVVPDDSGGLSYFWIILMVLIILVVGVVMFIVVRTIRQRQQELDQQKLGEAPEEGGQPMGAAEKPDVVQPEVVEAKPADKKPAEPAPAKEAPAKPAEQAGSTDKKPAEDTQPDSKKKDDEPPKGGDGPIPDWLKQ